MSASSRGGRRWADRAAALILLGAAGLVLTAVTPSLLRAAGVGAPARGELAAGPIQVPRPARARPIFSDDEIAEAEDDDSTDDLMRLYPGPGNFAGQRPRREEEEEGVGAVPRGGAEASSGLKVGASTRALDLFDQPDARGVRIGSVKAGESVMIVRDVGDWVLVVHGGAGDVTMGWTKKSGIAVR